MPQLYIDADNFNFISDPNFKSTTSSYTFKRGDQAPLYLNFVSGNTVLSADPGKTVIFGVKKSGMYDSSFVVSTSGYTIATSPFNGLSSYLLQPSFNTVELNQLLSAFDNDPGNDQASINLMGEVSVSNDGVNFDSTNTVVITVNNDVIRGDENTPLINPSPVDWLCTTLASLSCGIYVKNPLEEDESWTINKINAFGYGATISTIGDTAEIFTDGYQAGMYTGGDLSPIETKGSYSYIRTGGFESPIYTLGDYSSISTRNTNSNIETYALTSNLITAQGYIGSGLGLTPGGIPVKPEFPLDVGTQSISAATVNSICIRGDRTPASASATGTKGQICFDANYIYRCVDTNTWKRSPLTTWT